MRTHKIGVVSSNPARVTIKMQLVRKAAGNHLMKFTFLETTQGPVSGLCHARNRVCDAGLVGGRKKSYEKRA